MRHFGLVGYPLSHSFSEKYFADKFSKEQIPNVSYVNYPLESVDDFNKLINSIADLKGLNVTVPFKTSIIPFLDDLDPVAEKIGAVNTILFKNGKTKGYNTDSIGFRESLKPFLAKEHSRALIFGTGGSSKAIAFVLDELQIPYFFVSRASSGKQVISYTDLNKSSLKTFRLLINCTPVGLFPNVNELLPIDLNGIGKNHLVYDLIYNPKETKLLKEAKQRGALVVNGLSMLQIQAEASWKIWNT